MSLSLYICIHTYIYIYIDIITCVYIYIYIYIYTYCFRSGKLGSSIRIAYVYHMFGSQQLHVDTASAAMEQISTANKLV